ncbi:hypothetical protein [Salana multivorans]
MDDTDVTQAEANHPVVGIQVDLLRVLGDPGAALDALKAFEWSELDRRHPSAVKTFR